VLRFAPRQRSFQSTLWRDRRAFSSRRGSHLFYFIREIPGAGISIGGFSPRFLVWPHFDFSVKLRCPENDTRSERDGEKIRSFFSNEDSMASLPSPRRRRFQCCRSFRCLQRCSRSLETAGSFPEFVRISLFAVRFEDSAPTSIDRENAQRTDDDEETTRTSPRRGRRTLTGREAKARRLP
jgi:hypothetical protein